MSLENAAISLEAARDALEREGQSGAARTLKGLEVYSPEGARIALDALRAIHSELEETAEVLDWAIVVCAEASTSKSNAA